ncbi:histidine phosphatase superfamily [Xylariales sp. PMI_506]|nr:histidine phosphatase superfamily [Xylariales sp. PMI_506]
MLRPITTGLLAIVAAPGALGLTPVDTFYPPLNDTAWITNTTAGRYGGIYQASTYDSSSNATYGVFDYCAMPHPRAEEYSLPGPVANGNTTAKLVYLEYMQRHQRRTPYNILPNGESVPFDCNNLMAYLYAGAANASQGAPIPVYGKTYTSPTNPFVASFIPGSCQFPQLTIGGLLDGFQHGKDIWSVYGDKLGFLPSEPDDSIWLRSTESPLTQQSAGGVLRGIWPNFNGPLPLYQQASSVDTVNEGFSCSYRSTLLSEIESTAEWNEHLTVAQPLLDTLTTMLNADSSSWTETFDHFNDNFLGRLCNGYALPCNGTDGTDCVTEDLAEEVFRAGDWEWNYWYRNNNYTLPYIQTVEGVFIGEFLSHFQDLLNGNQSSVKYRHYFVHDNDLGPFLGALGIKQLRWPGMGSNIAFEVWQTGTCSSGTSGLYARVLYSGQPIETIYGTLDWIPLSELISILSPYVPADIVSLCSQ